MKFWPLRCRKAESKRTFGMEGIRLTMGLYGMCMTGSMRMSMADDSFWFLRPKVGLMVKAAAG